MTTFITRLLALNVLSLLMICSGLTQTACKKKVEYFPIADQQLRNALTFNPGTYFVYEDSLSKRSDSFYFFWVDRQDTRLKNSEDEVVAEFETSSCRFTDYPNYPKSYEFELSCGGDPFRMDKIRFIYNVGTGIPAFCIKLPFRAGDTAAQHGVKSAFTVRHDALVVAGKTYSDVFETFSSTVGGDGVHTFFSPDAGMVRFEIYEADTLSQNWILRRSRIIR